jgi:hypothetical protein
LISDGILGAPNRHGRRSSSRLKASDYAPSNHFLMSQSCLSPLTGPNRPLYHVLPFLPLPLKALKTAPSLQPRLIPDQPPTSISNSQNSLLTSSPTTPQQPYPTKASHPDSSQPYAPILSYPYSSLPLPTHPSLPHSSHPHPHPNPNPHPFTIDHLLPPSYTDTQAGQNIPSSLPRPRTALLITSLIKPGQTST